jgi:beta-mannosidase
LPAPLPARERIALPKQWKFTFEAKDTPKKEGVPPAPTWFGADFDDSAWEVTTVPEWRYRVREGDSALLPNTVDKCLVEATTADTICWYRTQLAAEKPAAGQRLWLCFDGVDWEAQVYLNGELLGSHRVYYEPFRFDVTDKIRQANTLAVRVLAGRSYGQPMTYWAVFPDIRAAQQRYVPDRSRSIVGNLPIGYHAGCGFGIHRDAYLERTGPVLVADIFARNDLSDSQARVKVELDSSIARDVEMNVQILPENCEGRTYEKTVRIPLPRGRSVQSLIVPMPEAKVWSPETPNLYRCRVTVRDAEKQSDAKDVLFGCRSFTLSRESRVQSRESNAKTPSLNSQPSALDSRPSTLDSPPLPDGMLLLNGKPIFLRGTNIQGLNAYAYWGQKEELLHAVLLLKAGHFNAVRSCQHVEFPEVREWFDRLGMMSEQDQGGGYRGSIDMGIRRQQHIHTGTVLARQCYNNPGVVLLCFGNEHEFDAAPIVCAALAVDPQRIIKPISGRFSHSGKPWDLPEELRANAIDDGHPYSGWYGGIVPQTWSHLVIYPPHRLVTLGEYGAEALDAYETMRDHYPPQFKPPAAEADSLWAASQVEKHDVRQRVGLGRNPRNLAEYIEASQNYQEALMADKTIGMRLSPRAVAGYFHFHFMDVVPVFWPKSIVSHDHRPKKAYYQMAQINQPIVALPQLTGRRPDAVTLWAANDLPEPIPQAVLGWSIRRQGQTLREGRQLLDVPALGVVKGERVDLSAIVAKHPAFDLVLTVADAQGRLLSRYQRTVRAVPRDLLK